MFMLYSLRNLPSVSQLGSYDRELLRARTVALHRGIELKPHKTWQVFDYYTLVRLLTPVKFSPPFFVLS